MRQTIDELPITICNYKFTVKPTSSGMFVDTKYFIRDSAINTGDGLSRDDHFAHSRPKESRYQHGSLI